MAQQDGIYLKKKFGQHFLKDTTFVDKMLAQVPLDSATNVFEIGGGSGILTRAILSKDIARLWVFEIDPEWVTQLQAIDGKRLTVYSQDFLTVDFDIFNEHVPWVLLANLPYQITFAVLYMVQAHRELFREGVVMIQEEVAQKIVKTSGRGYGFHALFLQHYFDWQLLDKVPPTAFYPAPKIFSRLLYFKPKSVLSVIPDAEKFWLFIKDCFRQPRRTLRNNLAHTAYSLTNIDSKILGLRAQQLSMSDFLILWEHVRTFSQK